MPQRRPLEPWSNRPGSFRLYNRNGLPFDERLATDLNDGCLLVEPFKDFDFAAATDAELDRSTDDFAVFDFIDKRPLVDANDGAGRDGEHVFASSQFDSGGCVQAGTKVSIVVG